MKVSHRNYSWVALWVLIAAGCDKSPQTPALTLCPEGATVVGAAPPGGFQQRCLKPGGIRHGPSRSWYADGTSRADTSWWNGIKHGKFTLWYENGQIRAQGEDYHGQAVGEWTYWDRKGNVMQHEVFSKPTQGADKP